MHDEQSSLDDVVGPAGGRLTLDEHRERLIAGQTSGIKSLAWLRDKYAGKRLIIAGGGPSINSTLADIRRQKKLSKRTMIMACNKTHDWLISKGIVPDFGIMLDPKPWVLDYMTPRKGVKYLLGSTVAPEVIEKFRPYDSYIYHPIGDGDGEYLLERFRGQAMALVIGYSTVGLRSVYVGEALGFDECELHGFDSCYDPKAKDLYVYSKPNTVRDHISGTAEAIDGTRLKYVSNRMMARQASEFRRMVMQMYQHQKSGETRPYGLKVAGDGLIPWQAWKMGIHTTPSRMAKKYRDALVWDYTRDCAEPVSVAPLTIADLRLSLSPLTPGPSLVPSLSI